MLLLFSSRASVLWKSVNILFCQKWVVVSRTSCLIICCAISLLGNANLSMFVIKHYTLKAWESEVYLHAILPWNCMTCFRFHIQFRVEPPSIYWTGGWLDPRAFLHHLEQVRNSVSLPEIKPRYLSLQRTTSSLYRLSCQSHYKRDFLSEGEIRGKSLTLFLSSRADP
jgi:hypothetical protein